MTYDERWQRLGPAGGGEPTCGAVSCEHHADGRETALVCVRRPDHAGAVDLVDVHVADLDGAPLVFDLDCPTHTPDAP